MLLPEPASDRVAQGKGTDWNDYEAQHGQAAARTALLDQIRQTEMPREIAPMFRPGEHQSSVLVP